MAESVTAVQRPYYNNLYTLQSKRRNRRSLLCLLMAFEISDAENPASQRRFAFKDRLTIGNATTSVVAFRNANNVPR